MRKNHVVTQRCTWCGERPELPEAVFVNDARQAVHHFHRECWRAHVAWLFGAAPKKNEAFRGINLPGGQKHGC